MKRIIVSPHLTCNARCAHCCVGSSPENRVGMDDDLARRIVAEACGDAEIEEISLTGGEAMLRKALVLELARTASAAGKSVTLVSNGFWGVTDEKAERTLIELRDAGVGVLTLSCDAFHSPHVSATRVARILVASRRVPGIRITLNLAESKSHIAGPYLEQLGSAAYGVTITKFPVTPIGQASSLANDVEFFHTSEDRLVCPGNVLLFHANARIYPCCSVGVTETALALGSTETTTLAQAKRRISHNILFRILQEEGLSWVLERLRDKGVPGLQEPFGVVDACHLCHTLFTQPDALGLLREDLAKYADHKASGRPLDARSG